MYSSTEYFVKKFFIKASIFIIFLCFLFLKLVYVFYGYIATEEGILLNNARYAFQGLLPFVDYNAWNSLINDYLVGWWHFFIAPNLFFQRLYGLLLSVFTFVATLKISNGILKNSSYQTLTTLFLTFGSYTYIYLSTIPYSEQTMTLFVLISILFLVKAKNETKRRDFYSFISILSALISTVIRIQAAPALVFLSLYALKQYKHEIKTFLKLAAIALFCTLCILIPFLPHPEYIWYAFTWPLKADKILAYQQEAKFSFTLMFVYFQELFRDYGAILVFTISGVIASIFQQKSKRFRQADKEIMSLLVGLSTTFAVTGLLHKPPYASYLYPATPLLSIAAAYFVHHDLKTSDRPKKVFLASILFLFLVNNFLFFPHYKFIKSSLKTISTTPHSNLSKLATIVQQNSLPSDSIISFYTPLAIASHRNVFVGLNEDRFSLAILDTSESQKYHLTNHEMLLDLILSKRAKIIAFSEGHVELFGRNEFQRRQVLTAIDQHYEQLGEFVEINQIEYPNAKPLKMYVVK